MTTIKDISIVGVTAHTLEDSSKSTAFVYDSADHKLFGVVYFTGAYWQVTSLGEPIDHELKKKLRVKVSKAIPSDYDLIDNPIEYFHNQKRVLKEASNSQKSYIEKLYGSCPQQLYADCASGAISIAKVYNMFMDPDYYKHRKEAHREEESNIKNMMTDFKSKDYKECDQFEFMNQLDKINMAISVYYTNLVRPEKSLKM